MNKSIIVIFAFAAGFLFGAAFVRRHYENLPVDIPEAETPKTEHTDKPVEKENVIPGLIKIAVISPDEFGDTDEYERISLTYYADGILADDRDDPILNAGEIVGFEALDSFDEYEEDTVFVRNDITRCCYEIIRDKRTFGEVTGVGDE